MLHEASPQTGSPHPSFHLKSFESTTCKQRARQNLGSKEFRNKIFGTKNLAVGALRKHAGLFLPIFSIAIRHRILRQVRWKFLPPRSTSAA